MRCIIKSYIHCCFTYKGNIQLSPRCITQALNGSGMCCCRVLSTGTCRTMTCLQWYSCKIAAFQFFGHGPGPCRLENGYVGMCLVLESLQCPGCHFLLGMAGTLLVNISTFCSCSHILYAELLGRYVLFESPRYSFLSSTLMIPSSLVILRLEWGCKQDLFWVKYPLGPWIFDISFAYVLHFWFGQTRVLECHLFSGVPKSTKSNDAFQRIQACAFVAAWLLIQGCSNKTPLTIAKR